MAHKGRKRNFEANRQPNGKVRTQVITANPIVLAHRISQAKDTRADTNDPLSVLFYAGKLRRPGEGSDSEAQHRYSAGTDLAGLYWRLFGKPFARGPGGIHGTDELDPVRALRDEMTYRQVIRELDALGRNTRRIVLDCCAHCRVPNSGNVARLIAGLETLVEMPRPKISDAAKDRARCEIG